MAVHTATPANPPDQQPDPVHVTDRVGSGSDPFDAGRDPMGGRPRPPVGLYLHIPFCVSLCPYCDFVVVTGHAARGPGSRIEAFVGALHAELTLRADALDAIDGIGGPDRTALRSVYLGGGTPSLLTAAQVAGLLDHIADRFGIALDAEVTLEANPGPTERGDIAGFRAAGVTRLSIGAQSMDPAELRRLGRRHDPVDVRAAIAEARAAGIRSVSVDLLMDVPGQTLASWDATLHAVASLEPDHVSTYQLTLDDPDAEGLTTVEGDHLPVRAGARRWRRRAAAEQDQDRAAAMDARADRVLDAVGLARYELSNRARPGHASRHNLAYWRREPVEAVGPGAHAFDGVTRRWNAARLDRYLAALVPPDDGSPSLPPGGTEVIDDPTVRAETAILGLRLADGIDAAFGEDPRLGPGLAWGMAHELVARRADRLVLTPRGRLLSNEVFARLLP
ncbi:MAG: coproporphyrinogen III oxidase family protein [Chloroflexi bacterium]|nr:coproporphyrinogen III oxidase family protein [Chloroflexota bacterium]